MKRKIETSHPVEAKIPSLSSFLKEENLDVDDIQSDVDQFLECYNHFVKYITDILDKKEKANAMKVSSIIIKFKELNRKAQFRLNISRDKTKETKDAINKNHLVMQNLLYEALHLEKETNSCLEFKSLHEDIELIPIEEFLELADDALKSYTSEHEMTLNRLHWELVQRKNLSAQITKAEEMEQQLLVEINKKRQAYMEISTNLKAVFNTTKPLENIFDLPMHHQDEQNALIELLPEPLYVLYLQIKIQADLDEQDMHVELVNENNSIKVVVHLKMNDFSLVLLFQWNKSLELVTVLPQFESSVTRNVASISKCFLDSSDLLSELPGDSGCPLQSPWILAKLAHKDDFQIQGFPYLWCQRISGMFSDIPIQQRSEHVTQVSCEYEVTQSRKRISPIRSLSVLLQDIRDRVKWRLQLCSDLELLSNANNLLSHVTNWNTSSFSSFKKINESNKFTSSGLVNEQCFFFNALIRSSRYQDDEIPMWLIIPHNYPNNNPIVVLTKFTLQLPGQDQLNGLSLIIHLLEVEVNCFCDEFVDDILKRQIARLLAGMDILLDQLHGECNDNKLNLILIGNKYPITKRPFRSNL